MVTRRDVGGEMYIITINVKDELEFIFFVWIKEWKWESEFEMIWKESVNKIRMYGLR